MRVGLVIPPTGFMLDDRVFPSLGILKVAAVLERAGHIAKVLDLSGHPNVADATREWIRFGPGSESHVVGITATTPQMPNAAKILRVLKDEHPANPVILGGPHVTLVNSAAKRELKKNVPGRAVRALDELLVKFDVLVAGDGERAILEAIKCNDKGHFRGLVDADDPLTQNFLKPVDLDVLPLPARHLIDMGSYKFEIGGHRAASLIGQLGCPFECGFCGGRLSPTFRRVRLRSADSVVDEMRHLHNAYGVLGFMFLDDELNVNKGLPDLLAKIAGLQAELGVRFHCRGLLKSQLFTDQQAELLVAAGFRELLIGFESGSERMLLNMNKKATRADNTRCMEIAARHGIAVKALMSIGHPGESKETVAETRDWLLEVKPAQFDVTVITVYPGTPYYDDADHWAGGTYVYKAPKTGDYLYQASIDQFEDTPFYKGTPGEYKAYVWTDHLSTEELVKSRDDLEREVRERLGIPWPQGAAANQFEHSMGQR